MSDVQDRLNTTLSRVDRVLAERTRREIEALQREDAAQEREAAAQARADSERCRQVQVKYADAFAAFGVLTPAPVEGEKPGRYRQRLYEFLRRKLPSDHDLFGVRADDIPAGDAARNFEKMMISAAMAEGIKPSAENLPASGELVRRERVDDMGSRSVEWLGRRSFIADMGGPSQRVIRFLDPRTRSVIMGAPLDRY